jgi:hypothetical protein
MTAGARRGTRVEAAAGGSRPTTAAAVDPRPTLEISCGQADLRPRRVDQDIGKNQAGRRVTAAEMAALRSWYLDEGYRRDSVEVREIVVAYPRATAVLDVVAYAMPANGRYHFTAMQAMLTVCQVGVVLGSIAQGFAVKPGELYMRDFTIVCRREINQTHDVRLRCELRRAQPTPVAVLYEIAYDYCDGAFSGTLRSLFPRRRARVGRRPGDGREAVQP